MGIFKAYGYTKIHRNGNDYLVFVKCHVQETTDYIKGIKTKVLLIDPKPPKGLQNEIEQEYENQGVWFEDYVWNDERLNE